MKQAVRTDKKEDVYHSVMENRPVFGIIYLKIYQI